MEATVNNQRFIFRKSDNGTADLCELCAAKSNPELCTMFCGGKSCLGYWVESPAKPKKRIMLIGALSTPEIEYTQAENMLIKMGFLVLSPAKNGLHLLASKEQHISRNLELMLTCDSVYLLESWVSCVNGKLLASASEVLKLERFFKQKEGQDYYFKELTKYATL